MLEAPPQPPKDATAVWLNEIVDTFADESFNAPGNADLRICLNITFITRIPALLLYTFLSFFSVLFVAIVDDAWRAHVANRYLSFLSYLIT